MATDDENPGDEPEYDEEVQVRLSSGSGVIAEAIALTARKGEIPQTGPLTDAEYNNLMVRQYETSLDGLLRTLVTNTRVNMQAIDQIARTLGALRRWVPVWFWEEKEDNGQWKTNNPWKRDEAGKPAILCKEVNGKSVPDLKNGKIQYVPNDSPEVVWVPDVSWKWVSGLGIEALRNLGDLDRKLESGEIRHIRKWFLSPTHNERNVIGPREAFAKVPKRVVRRYIRSLQKLQKMLEQRGTDYLIDDFYTGRRPEKWAPSDQWPDLETPRISLRKLNIYELSKYAEYRIGLCFFSAERRWKYLMRERKIAIASHKAVDKNGKRKPITDRQLENAIEKAYAWWTPYVQHEFVRRYLPDKIRVKKQPDSGKILDLSFRFDGVDHLQTITPAERADAFFDVVNQISWIIRYPTASGTNEVDWSDFLVYFPINEEIRDLARMVGHFQQSRSRQWRADKFNFSENEANTAVGADHGGCASARRWEDDITFEVVYYFCEAMRPGLKPEDEAKIRSQIDDITLEIILSQHPEAFHSRMSIKDWRQLRRDLIGPVHSRKPRGRMPANTAFYGEFDLRVVDITKGAGENRSAISVAREGGGLKWNRDLILKDLPKLRRYTGGEIALLASETYFWLCPWDITKNNGGLKSEGMINAFVNRLGIFTREDGEPLIEIVDLMEYWQEYYRDGNIRAKMEVATMKTVGADTPVHKPVKIDWFNQTEIRRQIIWKQPAKNIIPHLLDYFEDQKRERVVHIRPNLRKEWLNGLPHTLWEDPEFKTAVEQLNYRSDERLMDWAGFKNHGIGEFSARAVPQSFADRFLEDGFATDNGLPDEIAIEWATNLAILGWLSSQFDKAMYMAREIVYNHEKNVNGFEQVEIVGKAMGSGLHPRIAYATEEAITHNRMIQWQHFIEVDVPEALTVLDTIFNEVEAHLLGRESLEVSKRGGVFVAMRAA